MDERSVFKNFQSVKHIYNFDFELKKEQLTIIVALLQSRNVFVLLPTGYGKSMCFTLPPLLLDQINKDIKHVSVVVSPLKALMADQVKHLSDQGVRSIAVEPLMPNTTITEIIAGQYSVMFISPEMATSKHWRKIFLEHEFNQNICLLACDEAHCISTWGEDFRPQYRDVISLRSLIEAPVLSLTATCDEKVRRDIFQALCLDDLGTVTVTVTPDRPNIFLDIRECTQDYESQLKWLLDYLLEKKTEAVRIIVYCRSINNVSGIYVFIKDGLLRHGVTSGIIEMFHKSIDKDSEERILNSIHHPDSEIRCLISTIAFGMGIQIPNIRLIVHWGVPKCHLDYWQETGRAGRDGKPAYAICYAYGRSLAKNITEAGMIKSVKVINKDYNCVRGEILNALAIKGMAKYEQPRDLCMNDCQDACACSFCKCCNICKANCMCPMKVTSIGISLGIQNL